jgi:hypothetical protein
MFVRARRASRLFLPLLLGLATPATLVAQWSASGAPVPVAAANQTYPSITLDGAGGAILAWRCG